MTNTSGNPAIETDVEIIAKLDFRDLIRDSDLTDRDNNIEFGIRPKDDFPYYIRINDVKIYFEKALFSKDFITLFIDDHVIGTISKKHYVIRIYKLIFD